MSIEESLNTPLPSKQEIECTIGLLISSFLEEVTQKYLDAIRDQDQRLAILSEKDKQNSGSPQSNRVRQLLQANRDNLKYNYSNYRNEFFSLIAEHKPIASLEPSAEQYEGYLMRLEHIINQERQLLQESLDRYLQPVEGEQTS